MVNIRSRTRNIGHFTSIDRSENTTLKTQKKNKTKMATKKNKITILLHNKQKKTHTQMNYPGGKIHSQTNINVTPIYGWNQHYKIYLYIYIYMYIQWVDLTCWSLVFSETGLLLKLTATILSIRFSGNKSYGWTRCYGNQHCYTMFVYMGSVWAWKWVLWVVLFRIRKKK